MFQDEAGFGRINKPKYCWCEKGIRPSVPCHHIKEYRYVYGAVEPLTGESCFVVMPYCNTESMNVFLEELSNTFPKDKIILACDGAAWHKSGSLRIPENIELVFIPPYTPDLNCPNVFSSFFVNSRKCLFYVDLRQFTAMKLSCLCTTFRSNKDQIMTKIIGIFLLLPAGGDIGGCICTATDHLFYVDKEIIKEKHIISKQILIICEVLLYNAVLHRKDISYGTFSKIRQTSCNILKEAINKSNVENDFILVLTLLFVCYYGFH